MKTRASSCLSQCVSPFREKGVLISELENEVILKLTDQPEMEVLRGLHPNQSMKQTRIIPLLDVVDGRLMVLPLLTPLVHFL